MTHYFCTLFDSHYLLKGVVMLRTLREHCPKAHVFVLCMDDQAKDILSALALPHITCISLDQIETNELLVAKASRSKAEYCWTLSPCLPWFVLQQYPHVDSITYLDADLCFYSSLQPLFDEIGNASIAIIEHRFPLPFKSMEIRGRFCVEWVGFRRDEEGLSCLKKWREQCIEWCFQRLEGDRMGDQKYLDAWPTSYKNLHILQHVGAGVAPWNYSQYVFEVDQEENIYVDQTPLIFYHFHQFQILSNLTFDRLSDAYRVLGVEPNCIYEKYEAYLTDILADVKRLVPDFSDGLKPLFRIKLQRLAQFFLPKWFKEFFKKFFNVL